MSSVSGFSNDTESTLLFRSKRESRSVSNTESMSESFHHTGSFSLRSMDRFKSFRHDTSEWSKSYTNVTSVGHTFSSTFPKSLSP